MPRTNALSEAEERRKELSCRIQDMMNRRGYDNKKVAKAIGVSEKTFIQRKLHAPDEFSMADIWKLEKLFGCRISEPLCREEGKESA